VWDGGGIGRASIFELITVLGAGEGVLCLWLVVNGLGGFDEEE
jgi:hypothetical protein